MKSTGRVLACLAVLCLLLSSVISAQAAPAKKTQPLEQKEEVSARLDAANALFGKGEIKDAAAGYRALLREKLDTPLWGKVTFNLGIALTRLKEYDEAIRVFETIFPSAVDDREPGGHIMEQYRNYRYQACLQIAACYEAKGDTKRARRFLEDARTKHRYQAHCGNCAMEASESLTARIAALEENK